MTGGFFRGRLVTGMGAVVVAVVVIVIYGLILMSAVRRLLFADEAYAVVVFRVFLFGMIQVSRMVVVHRMQSPVSSHLHATSMLAGSAHAHMRHMTHLGTASARTERQICAQGRTISSDSRKSTGIGGQPTPQGAHRQTPYCQ
jgi:hypothetical protein